MRPPGASSSRRRKAPIRLAEMVRSGWAMYHGGEAGEAKW